MTQLHDTYSKFHKKVNFDKIVPKPYPLWTDDEKKKKGISMVDHHTRAPSMATFDLLNQEMVVKKRPLPEEYKSILEISCRAPQCPYPLNMDVWEAGVCFGCIYCYAIYAKSSLYAAWFDGNPWKARHVFKSTLKEKLKESFEYRIRPNERASSRDSKWCGATGSLNSIRKAVSQRIPVHLGVNSDDFIQLEKKKGISKMAMEYFLDHDYPIYITTKGTMLRDPEYLNLLEKFDTGRIAVQVSIIHNDDEIAKKIEPLAPSSTERWEMIETLNQCGIPSGPRMEPLMAYINADDDHLEEYANHCNDYGVKYVTLDSYSYFIRSPEVIKAFTDKGFDFVRMLWATSEFQVLGSYLLDKAMFYLKQHGIKCGTFNFSSIPYCDTEVCCCFDDWFKDSGYNKYNLWSATREIVKQGRLSLTEFDEQFYGMELSPNILTRVKQVWNQKKSDPWSPDWCEGVYIDGIDENNNIIYAFNKDRMGEGYKNLEVMFGE